MILLLVLPFSVIVAAGIWYAMYRLFGFLDDKCGACPDGDQDCYYTWCE